jgi:hypothetical protein
MKPDEFERKMRLGERFHHLRVEEDHFLVVRVDGRSFSRFTERKVEKPFDARFHDWMRTTTEALFVGFDGVYAFTESDEISVLLPQQTQLFDREVEKLVSLSASRAAATFSLACGEAVDFDARIWVGESVDDVLDYFRWRQDDATGRSGSKGRPSPRRPRAWKGLRAPRKKHCLPPTGSRSPKHLCGSKPAPACTGIRTRKRASIR